MPSESCVGGNCVVILQATNQARKPHSCSLVTKAAPLVAYFENQEIKESDPVIH